MTDINLKSPVEIYREKSTEHRNNTEAYFEELLKESDIDVEQNRKTVREYNAKASAVDSTRKVVGKKKLERVFLIFCVGLACVAVIIGIVQCQSDTTFGVLYICLGAVVATAALIYVIKKINPEIRAARSLMYEQSRAASELLSLAAGQTAPFNRLFTDKDALDLISKVMPEFEFDDKYTVENHNIMVDSYGFKDILNRDCSAVNTLSGRLCGSPFLYAETLNYYMGSHTYHGSLHISWTVTEYDSEGNAHTRTESETLHASVTKPKPNYYYSKSLYYGTQAASDLTFSRKPQHSERLNEKEIEKKVKKGIKKIEKRTEQATKSGCSFQSMSNTDFEVLFGAQDRNNEVQFRLMYTPVAQQNTVELLTSGEGYGDDFYFVKDRRINTIRSEHAQRSSLDCSAVRYYSHDVDEIKNKFLNFNVNFFKSLFFDFAPLMCIPAYMDCPSAEDIRADEYSNFTRYEHEVMANAVGADKFKHRLSATDVILKTSFVEKNGDSDVVDVTAYAFSAVQRVDYVSVSGGDGHWHDVPVEWTEFIPVIGSAKLKISKNDISASARSEGKTFVHGMSGEIL